MRFSLITMERFATAKARGLTFKPQVLGLGGSFERGRYVLLGLRCKDKRIKEARFESSNCVATVVAADWVCEKLLGANVDEALAIDLEGLLEGLGGLPPRQLFRARFALDALTLALESARKRGLL